jgi:hypothetical protein
VLFVGDVEVTHVYNASRAMSARAVQLHVMEDNDAVWLFFRRHQGRAQAATFTLICLCAALLRIAVNTVPLIACAVRRRPTRAWRDQVRISAAKARWSLRPGKGSAPGWDHQLEGAARTAGPASQPSF